MANLENAIERIKKLECPVGEIKSRVAGILEDYGVADGGQISVKEEADSGEGIRVYRCDIPGDRKGTLLLHTLSGSEDYVAKVTDVYLH